jgi:hypothetical protein
MRNYKLSLSLLVVCVIAFVVTLAGPVNASSLTYQYDMSVDPATQDLDGGGVDWEAYTSAANSPTTYGVSDGSRTVANYTNAAGSYVDVESYPTASEVWSHASFADGYSAEFSVKVDAAATKPTRAIAP